jgi:signal transduction histidine kinase
LIVGPDSSAEERGRRALPFLFAIGLGLALIPIQQTPIDSSLLAWAIAAIVAVVATAAAAIRRPGVPRWVLRLLPYLYLLSIALLRSATGGTRSGYVALLFLAPFWVALSDTRTQVVLVTIAMFVVQASQGLLSLQLQAGVAVRSALLSTVVIGMISLAVHASVSALQAARDRVRLEAEARAEANERLARSNDALARSNRDLEQFAYVSSHDLQEPLRMIRSFSQLFLQRYGGELDHEGRELLDFVVDGAERAQALVADLLEYSRVGTSERPFERLELVDVIERAIDVLAPMIEDSGARVFRPRSTPAVEGDPAQLERLFVNLIGNAIKYRHPDRLPELRIEVVKNGQDVQVSMHDNGIGFDDEHQERIFKMFQRLHARGEYDGTGIGLAICARIVERHGGTITAEGRPDEGSTFTLSLAGAS